MYNFRSINVCIYVFLGLLRLKPYYPHLDKEVKKKEAKQKECEEESGPSTAKQITVKFSKGENDKWKKQQELSYKNIMKKYDEESWIQCDWQPEKSELSEVSLWQFISL